jgi:glucose-1-phosphate thymidylyltransferase
MKGVLLHGGHGTRLRPLTHTGPKQLIPVGGKPISQYCFEDMNAAGVTEVAVILGNIWPEKVVEYYGDGSKLGMRFTYIDQGEPRGLAQAVSLAESFVGKDKFVMYLGDNLLKGGIAAQAKTFENGDADAMVLLSKVEDPERFGVAQFAQDGKLEKLVEKPKQAPSPYALVGVYFFTSHIFDAIRELKPSWRGEYEITDAIQSLLTSGQKVAHSFVEGWWKDTGTSDDILEANRLVLDDKLDNSTSEGQVEEGAEVQGRVRLGKNSKIQKGAVVRGPTSIGTGTVIIKGAYIGPYTSIGSNCLVSGCEIENSIVMDECRIDAHTRIIDSLIGPGTQITKNEGTPGGHRLILGEKCQLQL